METAERYGLIPGMSDAQHHATDAASYSRLVKLRHGKTPAHCRYAIDHPEETESMLLGSAFHCLCLQPGSMAASFAVRPDCDRRTKEGKEIYAEHIASLGSRREITAGQVASIKGMASSVLAHPAARVLLDAEGECELSAFWIDPEHDIDCKARFDKLAKFAGDKPCIVDLKTTEDASPEEFAKSIYSWGYFIQAAFYLYGAERIGLDAAGFAIIAVEKKPPYAVAVYELDNDAIAAGYRELQPLLAKYAECVKTNNWPAYAEGLTRISLPMWAMKKIEGSVPTW